MKICFIADSSSIHVQRIVSHHVRKKDEILILSSARQVLNIAGTTTVHLLDRKERSSAIPPPNGKRKTSSVASFKLFVPRSVKGFMQRVIRGVRLVGQRAFCIEQIQRFEPDVIYCFRSFPEGMLAAHCHVRPLLLRTAGRDISKLPKYPIYRQIIRRALQTADVLVTESLWERELLRDLCGAGVDPKVSIIGIDTTMFRPSVSRDRVRDKYGLPRDAFVVVSNRYLDGHYNGWLVVKTIQSILENCPRLVLLYVSPWKMGPRTKAKADAIVARFPRIKFLDGPLPHAEMPDILGSGDVYISFSSYDGVPNSLLEAMACGLVPIVGELPQLHEWIEQGVTGYIVSQCDTKGLACMVRDLYKNRQALSEMSTRCVSKIREQGSFELCSERTRGLLEYLIETDGGAKQLYMT